MSTHRVDVVEVKLETHPNADALEIVRVFGFTCCVRKGDFKNGELAAYCPPDTMVPLARPEFAFLQKPGETKEFERIRVRKLRGVVSQGLLIHAPSGLAQGDNALEQLAVKWYEPPIPMSTGGETEKPPAGLYAPVYDVENWRRYQHLFEVGEPIVAFEKLHGASARYVFHEDRMHVGSRSEWKRQDEKILWWQALKQNPWIEQFCRDNPGIVVYGEVFGQVQDLKYGSQRNQLYVRVFDLLQGDQWMPNVAARRLMHAYWVPVLYEGPYDQEVVEKLADGQSLIPGAKHLREGVVLQPRDERTHLEVGRVKLKIVSNDYLSR